MKVNEILNEAGFLGRLGQGLSSAAAGYRASRQQRLSQQELAKFAKNWIADWNSTVGKNPAINNPQGLKNYIESIVGNRLTSGEIPLPANMNPATVNQYITKILGVALTRPSQVTKNADQQKKSYQAKTLSGLATTTSPQATKPSPNSPIITNTEPIQISYQGRTYGLDDQGQWIHLKSGRVQPEALQAFLDQMHQQHLGI